MHLGFINIVFSVINIMLTTFQNRKVLSILLVESVVSQMKELRFRKEE